MHAARLEQKRQKRELGGSMANAGTVEGPETLFLTGCLAGKFDLLSISLLEAKACYKGGDTFALYQERGAGKQLEIKRLRGVVPRRHLLNGFAILTDTGPTTARSA